MNDPSSTMAVYSFVLLTVVSYAWFLKTFFSGIDRTGWANPIKIRYKNSLLIALLSWGVVLTVWSLSGMMADFSIFPLNFLPVLAIPLIAAIVLTSHASTSTILGHIPVNAIIQIQVFRFFVEVLLWVLCAAGSLPIQMTFEGLNFDILAGISAPFVGWLSHKQKISRTGLILWNVISLLLLLNIVIIAILSTPSPMRHFMNEPANTIVTAFPAVFLPGFLVPLAYTLHFLSIKQLMRR